MRCRRATSATVPARRRLALFSETSDSAVRATVFLVANHTDRLTRSLPSSTLAISCVPVLPCRHILN
eukprot:2855420-Pleurochrysis_carterae.AAC.1